MNEEYISNGYKLEIGRRRTRVTTYENLKLHTTQPMNKDKPKKIKPNIPSNYAGFNYFNRMKQRRESIKELVYNNFDTVYSAMVTLTFEPSSTKNYSDLKVSHTEFKKFIQRMNTHYSNFKYVATFNRQKNGNWHYHVFCNLLATTKRESIRKLWNNGSVYVSGTTTQADFDTKLKYLIDNMTGAADDIKGKHGYLASKNLERNIVLTSYKQEDIEEFDKAFAKVVENKRTILYSTKNHLGIQGEYVSEETGEIKNVKIPNMELDAMLEQAGYKSWDTIYTHLSSAAKFDEKFSELLPATPKHMEKKKAKTQKGKNVS